MNYSFSLRFIFFLASVSGIISLLVPRTSFSAIETHTGISLDTLGNSIELMSDEEGNPLHYKSEIFTPVCAVGECLPIKINLYWTLAGNYLKYELPEGEILTKVDHVPFTPEDYSKLDGILRIKNSTLRYLINEPRKVDGTTGPTGRASQRDYVSGAIYTSLTLYGFIYGPAAQQIREYTQTHLINDKNLDRFLDHPDPDLVMIAYNYVANHLSNDELTDFIFGRMDQGEKFPELAVLFIPKVYLHEASIQNKLIAVYLGPSSNQEARLHILSLWEDLQLTPEVQEGLVTGFIQFKTHFEQMDKILKHQTTWSDEVYYKLKTAIEEENNMKRKESLYKLLASREKTAPKTVKKFLKDLRGETGWN